MSESTTEQHPNVNGAHEPRVVSKESAYRATAEATELIRVDAGDITADSVTLDRSGAENITADRVRPAFRAKAITTKSAQLDRSGVLDLKADHVVLQRSTATIVSANEIRIVKSNIGILRANSTHVEGELRTLVHIGNASDSVKPVFNGSSAIRFGAALGAVLLFGGRLLRMLYRR